MTNQEQLHTAMNGTEWQQAAQEMQAWGWELDEQVQHYTVQLVSRVLSGMLTVNELRAGISWASALDAEAVNHGVGINDQEALARRIAHQAGRKALATVGTEVRQSTERARRAQALGRLGTDIGSRLKHHDLGF